MMQWLIRATCPRPVAIPEPVPSEVAVRSAAWLPAVAGFMAGMGAPAAAVTLGRTIVVHPSVRVTPRLIRHELAHVRQWQSNRWTFALRYVGNHLRFGYTNNPYEVEARQAESRDGSD